MSSENTHSSTGPLDVGVSCRSCWRQEGGLCYVGDPPRDKSGRSLIEATKACEHHKTKRRMFESIGMPPEKLIIFSERTGN